MAKQKGKKKEAEPETPVGKKPGEIEDALESLPQEKLPSWFWITAFILIVAGAGWFFTRESRAEKSAIDALNEAQIEITEYRLRDGFGEYFADAVLADHRDDYARLLSNKNRSLRVFRELLKDNTHSESGQILAMNMAFYMTHDEVMTSLEDLKLLTDKLSSDNAKIRCSAQRALGFILASKNIEAEATFKTIPKEKQNVKDKSYEVKVEKKKFYAKKYDQDPKYEYLTFKWASPGACQAWWETFGKDHTTWDAELKRFVVKPK